MTTRDTLAELAASGTRLRPAEAVAVVSELCRRNARVESTEEVSVAEAAQLLSDLLPDNDVPAEYRASGALRLVIARALGILDLPPYEGLEDFCAALSRFGDEPDAPAASLVRSDSHHLVPIVVEPRPGRRSRVASWMLAASVAALLALATFAILMQSAQGRLQESHPVSQQAATTQPVVVATTGHSIPAARPAARVLGERPRVRPAALRPPPTRHKSFFRRELFRIVIK